MTDMATAAEKVAARAAEQASKAAEQAEARRLEAEQTARETASQLAEKSKAMQTAADAKEGKKGTLKYATDYVDGANEFGHPVIKTAKPGTKVSALKLDEAAVAHLHQHNLIETED